MRPAKKLRCKEPATILWKCESGNVDLLHISLHLFVLGGGKNSVHWDEDPLDLVSGKI